MQTPRLSRPTILGNDVFQEYGNYAFMQLLIDDMGGFGGFVEVLHSLMTNLTGGESLGPKAILTRVAQALLIKYPPLQAGVLAMRAAFLAVEARRIIRVQSKIGELHLDDVLSCRLFRCHNGHLECPNILCLLFDYDEFPTFEFGSYVPIIKTGDPRPWQEWEIFNCKYRILKANQYALEESVNWTDLHKGTRFGPGCDRIVNEVPRSLEKSDHRMVTACAGYGILNCLCGNNSDKLRRPGSGSPSGDSFLCLRDNKGFFHEVHQYKSTIADLTEKQFEEELKKAAGKDDLFVLYCTANVKVEMSKFPNCAIVDRSCWEEYYGPFVARAYFTKIDSKPRLRASSEVEIMDRAHSESTSNERKRQRLSSYEDASEKSK